MQAVQENPAVAREDGTAYTVPVTVLTFLKSSKVDDFHLI